jgi:hypothetical protein
MEELEFRGMNDMRRNILGDGESWEKVKSHLLNVKMKQYRGCNH